MKVLLDTSVWIEYLKGGADELDELLAESRALVHPVVIGELSCGGLKGRNKALGGLKLLPKAKEAGFSEVLELIETHKLYGKGLGFNNVQLLASALISEAPIFSFDKAVIRAARGLDICFPAEPA